MLISGILAAWQFLTKLRRAFPCPGHRDGLQPSLPWVGAVIGCEYVATVAQAAYRSERLQVGELTGDEFGNERDVW